jgi:hypothetical protein
MTKGLPFLVFDRDLVTAPAPVETDMDKMKRKALALGLEII